MVAAKLMTAEELERLPDDGHKYELVRGELIRTMPTGFEHLRVSGLLMYHVNAFVLPRALGVVGSGAGFVLERGPDTIRAPDVAFVRADQIPHGEAARHFVERAPDLAAEARSPAETLRELRKKADEYMAAGSRLVWIVDPLTRSVIVKRADGTTRTLRRDHDLDGGEVLPGFVLCLSEIFRNED